MGVDYGLKKIGLAISEGSLASPFRILQVSGLKDALNQLKKVIKDENITKVIVGLPDSEVKDMILKAVNSLQKEFDVVTVDETLSSSSARGQMINLNIPKRKRGLEDAFAAAEILQNYLDNL